APGDGELGEGRAREVVEAVDGAAGPRGGVVAEVGVGDPDGDRVGAVGHAAEQAGAGSPGVVREGVARDRQRGRAGVFDDEVDAAAAQGGAVAGQGGVVQGQRAFALDAAAEVAHLAVGDGQAGDGHAGAAQSVEDALGVVAADGDAAGARPQDAQVLADG